MKRDLLPLQVPESSMSLGVVDISLFWLEHFKSLEPADLRFCSFGEVVILYVHTFESDILSECEA